jgi:hypothetical protein
MKVAWKLYKNWNYIIRKVAYTDFLRAVGVARALTDVSTVEGEILNHAINQSSIYIRTKS